MKNILNVIALLLLIGGGLFIYQKFITDRSVHIVENIQHELMQTEEFVFSRDKIKFSETQNNAAGLARLNYLYTWEASVPFGFKSSDLDLDYDKATKRLRIKVNNLRLFKFTVENQKDQKTFEFAWLNQGEPAQKFWKNINAHTRSLLISEFKKDPSLAASVVNITRNSLTASVLNIMNKLKFSGIGVEVVIDQLKLYNGQTIPVR